MNRYYFVSNDLADLKKTEEDFFSSGFTEPQLHVLSEQDSELVKYKLHEVNSFSKSDVVSGGMKGAIIGLFLAMTIIGFGMLQNASGMVTWLPFLFLAFLVFCFSTWEGGLYGIQKYNSEFRRFEPVLKQGKHVLIVDLMEHQQECLELICRKHPSLTPAGQGHARSWWMIRGQENVVSVVKSLP